MPPTDRPPKFRRLPGQVSRLGPSLVGRASALWLGADELVQIEIVFWAEKTRRFAYADIQALLLRETVTGLVLNLVFGGLAAVFGVLAWGMENAAARAGFAVVAGGCLLLLIYTAVRGGTCRCTLQTALGSQALPSLNRRRPARKALRLLAERVDAAQVQPAAAVSTATA